MATPSKAWLLRLAQDCLVAVSPGYMVEYLPSARMIPVPLTPRHAPGVLVWRSRLIPVLDLGILLTDSPPVATPQRRAMVLAYQALPGAVVHHGALFVQAPPTEIDVTDGMACALPDKPAIWEQLSHACFLYEKQRVPVINLLWVFMRSYASLPHSVPEAVVHDPLPAALGMENPAPGII